MPHDHVKHEAMLRTAAAHISGLPHATAKKEALFDTIHGDIGETIAEMRASGVSEDQLTPLVERQKKYEELKPVMVGLDLG